MLKRLARLAEVLFLVLLIGLLAAEVLLLLTGWLDEYANQLHMLMFLVVGLWGIYWGFRMRLLPWGLLSMLAGAAIVVYLLAFPNQLNPIVLAVCLLMVVVAALFGKRKPLSV
jgi:hypothetical protein